MLHYKEHPINGIAVPQADGGWHCTGLVFEPEQKVTEIQWLKCTDLIFRTKKQAEEHALSLCRSWIDALG
jgi:hypothetical protein